MIIGLAVLAVAVAIFFLVSPSGIGCIQDANACCKGRYCESIELNCIRGTYPTCGDCNDDCTPNCWCEAYPTMPPDLPKDPQAIQTMNDVVAANNQFAIDFYDNIASEEGNVFFSPFSLETALAMTYEGAKGQTATEMQAVLHIPSDDTSRRAGFAGLMNDINSGSDDYKLSTANALWAEYDFTFLDDYFQVVDEYYLGKVTNLDYVNDPEGSRRTINTWVEEQTNNKIKDLIPPGLINDMTRLVLTNAIYFKGTWVTQFEESDTHDADFHVSDSETSTVKMMYQKNEFKYKNNGDLELLEMPYEGDELSMVIVLPKDDLEDIDLMSLSLNSLRQEASEKELNVYIPRFKFETKYMLKPTLQDMGMPTAFSRSADFSGMTGKDDLMIDEVIHQAFVEVNEEGTEAAAATAVIMIEKAAAPSTMFRADHPFIFFIMKDDAILFMGRVSNPVA